jgi:Chaperone of endosialidase
MKIRTTPLSLVIFLALGCFALCSATNAFGVVPPPDGGYPGGNTAEGSSALFSLTSGTFNTAIGFLSLSNNTEGQFNTAVGAGTLLANVGNPNALDGVENTAIGAGALLSNTTGDVNTANGAFALFDNTTGGGNTANGVSALLSNTEGSNNTATGFNALHDNTIGFSNTATGRNALFADITGSHNTAVGFEALGFDTSGNDNTAIGENALENNRTGRGNIAVGVDAAINIQSASNVICIGTSGEDASNGCYIGQIFGATSSGGAAVFINSSGKLGTTTCSRRFKEEIKPMEQASETLYALKPVSFRYKSEIDPERILQFGLVAEDVEAINPDLVVRDKRGNPYSVRYDAVNAMLLNEFLKEHKKVEEQDQRIMRQEATMARQQKQIDALTSDLQKVTFQIDRSQSGSQIVLNR